jgi:hypothetical protein
MGLINFFRRLLGLDSKETIPAKSEQDLSHLINENEVLAMPVEDGLEHVKNLEEPSVSINEETGEFEFNRGYLEPVNKIPLPEGKVYYVPFEYPKNELAAPESLEPQDIPVELEPVTVVVTDVIPETVIEVSGDSEPLIEPILDDVVVESEAIAPVEVIVSTPEPAVAQVEEVKPKRKRKPRKKTEKTTKTPKTNKKFSKKSANQESSSASTTTIPNLNYTDTTNVPFDGSVTLLNVVSSTPMEDFLMKPYGSDNMREPDFETPTSNDSCDSGSSDSGSCD